MISGNPKQRIFSFAMRAKFSARLQLVVAGAAIAVFPVPFGIVMASQITPGSALM